MGHILTFSEFINERYLAEKLELSDDDKKKIAKIFDEHKKDELTSTKASDAYKIAVDMLGEDRAETIFGTEEEFSKRFEAAAESAKTNGKYKRGEMPVINNAKFGDKSEDNKEAAPRKKPIEDIFNKDNEDKLGKNIGEDVEKAVLSNQVLAFKFMVGHGLIDINGDNDNDNVKKATQETLLKDDSLAKDWLSSGEGVEDKKDVVKGDFELIPVKDLKPIQEQIFVAKSIKFASKAENKDDMAWLLEPKKTGTPITLVSKDNFILDGHHRWLGAYLIDDDAKMSCIKIDMDKDELLKLTNKFTGAIGNEPNKTA
jgi:hypothetical protein